MGLSKKQIIGSLLGVFSIILISLVISLPKSQQKQSPPPQNLMPRDETAIAKPNENPRIKEIIQLAAEKRAAYQKLQKQVVELESTTNTRCAPSTSDSCKELMEKLASDAEIVIALTAIYQNGGIQIMIYPDFQSRPNKIYINDSGILVIRETAHPEDIRKFLGLKPKK